jgi:hypothetical protein
MSPNANEFPARERTTRGEGMAPKVVAVAVITAKVVTTPDSYPPAFFDFFWWIRSTLDVLIQAVM